MTKVRISLLEKKQAYGRLDYFPVCNDAFYILGFAKNRTAFKKKEIQEMRKLGWELDITTEKPGAKK